MITIPIDNIELKGDLFIPDSAIGLVIFAHGSGSGRHSPRNKFVAQELNKKRLATLLVDLLSEEEDLDYQARFNIALLTKRLLAVTNFMKHNDNVGRLAFGYFGASTGAAAAILAANGLKDLVRAIVSRGGRVDLAYDSVQNIKVPTLLIVGGEDHTVRNLNKEVFSQLKCKKDLVVVPGATHLFEEPGKLEQVADLAGDWFVDNLIKIGSDSTSKPLGL